LETKDEHVKKELSLGLWEKYLTLWIGPLHRHRLARREVSARIRAVHGLTQIRAVINSYRHSLVFHDLPNGREYPLQ
jgi:hypothetical protein